jgi:2-polyprenyl-3-methyl-5-hydroxy-6-metoxy-1,4-benzoquinol methylase
MRRCENQELMDAPDATDEDLAQSYRELRRTHALLGNTGALLRLLRRSPRPIRQVIDIGCGQGALLLEIREKLGIGVIGIDLRPAPANAPVPILTGNAVTDLLPEADVAVCMMVAHHLSEEELEAMIRNVSRSCNRFILLDLVRHPVPLALFRIFVSPLLGRINSLDGQTSIRRAFTAAEMRRIVDGALENGRHVSRLRHTVSPFWTRQIVDICWEGQGGPSTFPA